MGISLRPITGIFVCLAFATSVALGATLTSVQDGDWSDPATWGNPPGGDIPADADYVNLYHEVTADSAVNWTGGHRRLVFQAGGNLIMDGGWIEAGRVQGNGIGPAIVVEDGYLYFDRVDNAGGYSVTINGGEFRFTSTIGQPTGPVVNNGGVYRGTLGTSAIEINNGGTWDLDFGTGQYIPYDSLVWNDGTIANLNQAHDYTQRQIGNLADNPARRIDINDQNRDPGVAHTWDMKSSARDRWEPLVGTAGTIQFDAYSDADNDCDTIIEAANHSSLGGGVLFEIGYAGAPILDPAAFVGTSYQLIAMASNTDFSALTPTVPVATWDDGATTWTVTFQNDVSTDGTVTITSIVPEPATLALLACGGLLAVRRRR